jgi:predicted cobalt transporter CbtA
MSFTYRAIITRALTAGLTVGVLVAGYTFFVVEPTIDEAIALEEQLAAEAEQSEKAENSHDEEEPLFTRSEQVGGGLAASLIYAVILSAVFGTVFAATRHRLPGRSDLLRSLWLAAVAFGCVALVPALKYPANPPAVGDPDTVGERTVQWLVLVAVSVLLAWALTRLSGSLRSRLDESTRVLVMTAATVTAFGALLIVLPGTPDNIDPRVPAALVWDFRIRSIGGLALLWCGLGVGLGWLLERDGRCATDGTDDRTAVPA